MDTGAFAVGIDWKYEDGSSMQYQNSEYRVYPRYPALWEEMREYDYLPFSEIELVSNKAKKYLNSAAAKSLKAWDHKGINQDGPPIKRDSLVCIILYCDYTELSRDFTASFRKSHQYQLLSQINKHNSKYYHWSKTLKDTVKKYGQQRMSSNIVNNGITQNLVGPFYCGMSQVLNIFQFEMSIYSPLSTSIQLQIALKFSGATGMLLELDNSKGYKAHKLKGFDVS